jgi:predicted DNA-binding transcriptional regulator AlpA
MARERTSTAVRRQLQAVPDDRPPRSPAELSEYLGIPERTLTQWRWMTKQGVAKGPRFVRIGRYVRYPRRDTEEWLDAGADSPEHARASG